MLRSFRSLPLLLALTTLIFTGCSKDDSNPIAPIPDPIADFTMSGATVTPANITFNNASTNADRYNWDFGDGRTSVNASPSMAFNTHGSFTVTLIATMASTSKSDTTRKTLTITPGMVFLDSVVVESIPWVDDDGAGWDEDGTGPDIYALFADSTWDFEGDDDPLLQSDNVDLDVRRADLPYTWEVSPSYRILNWGMDYGIAMIDIDADQVHLAEFMGGAGFSINGIIAQSGYVRTKTLTGVPDGPNPTEWRVRLVLRWQ